MSSSVRCWTLASVVGLVVSDACGAGGVVSAGSYGSIQQAIDANPGRMILLPQGDHVISKKLRMATDGGGLYGYGRIVQTNPAEAILEIEHASGVRVRDLTLTRVEGHKEATAPGLFCWDSHDVVLDGVTVVDNRSRDAAIELRETTGCTVRSCRVVNYKRIAVDDRTDSEHYGYAFFCIDGTGILVTRGTGTMILDNRIVERNLLPTRELKQKHRLGMLTKGKRPSRQGTLAAGAFKRKYVNNWHQGSAIVVTAPEATHHTIIRGNYIENAAQGIDLHADHVICSNNVVNHGMMGIKATHGCRNLIIADNLLTHVDLWGILLNPGTASHGAEPASDGKPARPANVDAGTMIVNNIISDYGYGHEYWNWGGASDDQGSSYAIALYEGQLPRNPPLTDVLVQGNIVYNTGRDKMLVDGKPRVLPPRYRYAVYVGGWDSRTETGPTYPRGLHFSNNLFHPGTRGVSNVKLKP